MAQVNLCEATNPYGGETIPPLPGGLVLGAYAGASLAWDYSSHKAYVACLDQREEVGKPEGVVRLPQVRHRACIRHLDAGVDGWRAHARTTITSGSSGRSAKSPSSRCGKPPARTRRTSGRSKAIRPRLSTGRKRLNSSAASRSMCPVRWANSGTAMTGLPGEAARRPRRRRGRPTRRAAIRSADGPDGERGGGAPRQRRECGESRLLHRAQHERLSRHGGPRARAHGPSRLGDPIDSSRAGAMAQQSGSSSASSARCGDSGTWSLAAAGQVRVNAVPDSATRATSRSSPPSWGRSAPPQRLHREGIFEAEPTTA
jgi:hypothetical protein